MTRRKLPPERRSVTRTLRIVGADPLYVNAGFFDDGSLAEVFVFNKAGDQIAALCDAFAMAVSMGLQHGIPASAFTDKIRGYRVEPYGMTGDPEFPMVSSYLDYLARWIDRLTGAAQ